MLYVYAGDLCRWGSQSLSSSSIYPWDFSVISFTARPERVERAMERSSPSLDFLSEEFDALEALRTEGLQPPNPRVRPLDNLNKCRRILPQEVPESLANVPVREPRTQESIEAQRRAKARTSLVLEKVGERARQTKILDHLAEKLRQGPLSLLVECYEQRGRVQIWTRHSHGVRGALVGFLQALDKHFNMVLQDVDEQYTVVRRVPRPVRKRGRVWTIQSEGKDEVDSLAITSLEPAAPEVCAEAVETLIKEMKEVKLFPKLENRRRHLKQVFVRGASVVMVRKL